MNPPPDLITRPPAGPAPRPVAADLFAGIQIDPECHLARFDGHEVTADDLRQLESELGRRLYEHRHVGRDHTRQVAITRRDLQAETQLREQLPEGRVRLDLTGHRTLPDGRHTASLLGARVLLPGPQSSVELSDVWPAISPGFLMVLGPERPRTRPGHALWRLYLAGADIAGAGRTFAAVVEHLRRHARHWQAKVTSVPGEYPRTDAVTVYLDAGEEALIPGLVEHVHRVAPPGWERTSAYTLRLAEGTALAQEPDDPDPRRRDLSFGQHRASLVCAHLLHPRHDDLTAALRAAGVDPLRPWRNLPATPEPESP